MKTFDFMHVEKRGVTITTQKKRTETDRGKDKTKSP